jgi:hypothetical protein
MRYKLDVNGYVLAVFWGCNSGNCAEYTGEVPTGYPDLITWSENALINAYYIDSSGNLVLDSDRKAELEEKVIIEEIDNTPLFRKDLYGSNEILDSQYQKQYAIGTILKLENVKNIAPKVKITNIDYINNTSISLYSHGRNMLKNDGKTETINGVDFTSLPDGSIRINGTATENIEYNLSGNSENAIPIFVLKNNTSYYLNIGGYDCEMKYHDGETTAQVYTGASGVINLSEDKEVTQVLLKIPKGTTHNTIIFPMLNYGTEAEPYEEYRCKVLNVDLGEPFSSDALYPSDELYPSDDLFPSGEEYVTDYILIENGAIYVSRDNVVRILRAGNVQLLNGNNTLYVDQDATIEILYSIDVLVAEERINAKIERTAEGLNFEVSKKVDNEDFTSANIMLKINGDTSEAQINADKININGTVSANGNFKVDIDGNMECNNAKITGGKIHLSSSTGNGNLLIGSGYTQADSRTELRGKSLEIYNADIGSQILLDSTDKKIYVSDGNGNTTYIYDNTISVYNNWSNYTKITGTEVIAQKLTQTSLAEQKKNFEKLQDNAIDIIKNIDIYKYNLKSESDTDKKHIGFVIGDDYNYSEEVTSLNNKGVDNYSFTSLCCKAIQEQQKIIEDLQKEIKELKEVKQ